MSRDDSAGDVAKDTLRVSRTMCGEAGLGGESAEIRNRGAIMKRYVWFCLVLAGCSTNSGGQQFSTDAARQIHVGIPKSSVQTLLGAPLNRSVVNGEETWTYSYVESNTSVSPVSLVPYVNMVAGGATNSSVSKTISIRFRGGNVARCSINISAQNTSMSGGFVSGYRQDGGQTQTFENDCDKQ